MSLEITVHGLKEKLFYLEGVYEENMKKDLDAKEAAALAAGRKAQEEELERQVRA